MILYILFSEISKKAEILLAMVFLQVIYSLQLSPLSAFKSTIDKISHFENDIANKNDWDIESFESQFESDLKMYDMNLKEEIKHFYS